MNNLITYRTFLNKEDALELIEALSKNNIPNLLEDNKASFDPTFVNIDENDRFFLKIPKEHFETADQIQLELANKIINSISHDHYLFEFTDDELIEVINKKDEWSKIDYLLAQKLLKERGKTVSQESIDASQKQRIIELSNPEPASIYVLIMGYIFAFIGILLGILIGWHLRSYKKLLPNGERVYAYSDKSRKHGTIIIIIAGSIGVLALFAQIIHFYIN